MLLGNYSTKPKFKKSLSSDVLGTRVSRPHPQNIEEEHNTRLSLRISLVLAVLDGAYHRGGARIPR